MDFKYIVNQYKNNLATIFSNEQVIESIYKEQYGEKTYLENKEEYNNRYKEIMSKTMFVPYITLEHLQNLVKDIRYKYGEKYLLENFKELNILSRNLTNKKNIIIKDYTERLLQDIKSKMPKIKGIDNILKDCTNEEPQLNEQIIQLAINKNNKLSKLQENKLRKIMQTYQKDVKEKILIETSSYFIHKSEITNDQYYTSILDGMLSNGQFVTQAIGKDSSKNFRYVFLPVLQYRTEQEYLKNAFHEVMHISKEHISNKKYVTGLFERIISSKGGNLLGKDNPINNILSQTLWKIYKNKANIKVIEEPYHSYMGESFIEETSHHWQVRNVVNEAMNLKILPPIHMMYRDKNVKTNTLYEQADTTTKLFMQSFGDKIQDVNSGKTTIRGFKKNVGVINYKLLGNLYNEWLGQKKLNFSTQFGSLNISGLEQNDGQELYSELGEEIVGRMTSKSKRNDILEKTYSISPKEILNVNNLLRKMKKRKETIDNTKPKKVVLTNNSNNIEHDLEQ